MTGVKLMFLDIVIESTYLKQSCNIYSGYSYMGQNAIKLQTQLQAPKCI